MPRRLVLPLLFLATLSIILPLAGCSAKPENSPVIRKKFAELDQMKTDMNESTKQLRAMAGDMTIIKDQVSNLRALSPDGEGNIEVITRLEAIEQRLSKMEQGGPVIASASTKSDAPAKSLAEALKADAPAGLAVPAVKEVAEAVSAPKKAESTPKKSTGTAAAKKAAPKKETTKTVASASRTATPRGKYYVIQAGDTLDKIASTNGVSLASLKKANNLPAGAKPLKGQRLFVPADK